MKLLNLLVLLGAASAAPIPSVNPTTTSIRDKLAHPPINVPIPVGSIPSALPKTQGHQEEWHNVKVDLNENWAGAAKQGTGINRVQGTFVVPKVDVPQGSGFAVWVGIDGRRCDKQLLQTGVFFRPNGKIQAFRQWSPKHARIFHKFPVSPGDEIRMTVYATSAWTGIAHLENLTKNKAVTHTFEEPESPGRLCKLDASWIVDAYKDNGKQVTLADFGNITIKDASYSDSTGTGTLKDAVILDIKHSVGGSSSVETYSEVKGNSVTVWYNGDNGKEKRDTQGHKRDVGALENRHHDDVEDGKKKLETHRNWRGHGNDKNSQHAGVEDGKKKLEAHHNWQGHGDEKNSQHADLEDAMKTFENHNNWRPYKGDEKKHGDIPNPSIGKRGLVPRPKMDGEVVYLDNKGKKLDMSEADGNVQIDGYGSLIIKGTRLPGEDRRKKGERKGSDKGDNED
ncbi:hypothetical protein IL306_012913 [Fusarium sp. DS 682]|nr:hypothetical protein IL306_012913 [Fusarium sp. DS 682]